jgi:hypothetical protein
VLTVQSGDRTNNEKLKTEAMHMLRPGETFQPEAINDINTDSNQLFSFCNKFKNLGSVFNNKLNGTEDIDHQIQQTTAAFASLSDNVLRNKNISKKLRKLSSTCH